jgi:hypothetical protein
MMWKKAVGMVVIGLMIAGVLYAVYRIIVREPPITSPLPDEEGVNVIFITPEEGK